LALLSHHHLASLIPCSRYVSYATIHFISHCRSWSANPLWFQYLGCGSSAMPSH
jgi:hypothetical protein